MGFMLGTVGFIVARINKTGNEKYLKFIYTFSIILLFLLIWRELAVGFFGTPFAGD